MAKFLDMDGLVYLWTQLKGLLGNKVDKEEGKALSTNDYTNDEKTKLANIAENANNYVHPDSGVSANTYTSVAVNAQGHVITGSNPTTLEGYGIIDAADKIHTHTNDDIISLDASKLTGSIDISLLPTGALERLVIVETDEQRLALTTDDIQKGDTVKVVNTGLMYFVTDDTKLDSEDGYEVYTAGTATAVAWSGVTGKPSVFTPDAHTHTTSDITDFPIALKNPTALSITVNGTTISYDGSLEQTIILDESTFGITTITTAEIDTIIAG